VELNFTDTLQERFIQFDQSLNIPQATLMATLASDIPLVLVRSQRVCETTVQIKPSHPIDLMSNILYSAVLRPINQSKKCIGKAKRGNAIYLLGTVSLK
jgi:hypothetical protein